MTQNLSFYDRFIVTGGVRNDSLDISSEDRDGVTTSDDFSETSVRGALTYRITDEISTYISMVESVAPPSIGVKPERGEQYEIGAKYAPFGTNALFSAAIYDLTRNDVTISVTQDNGVIERETVGESRVKGLDLEAKVELSDNLSLIGGYSYMDSEVVRDDNTSRQGNEFAIAPKHSASLWGYYTLPATPMSVGLGARYTGTYYYDVGNTSKSDATTLYDAALSYQIVENTDLTVNVSNLFDEQHVVGSATANYYNPGREITAKVSYQW